MNEVVKMHNDFMDVPCNTMTANEMNMFFAICWYVQNNDSDKITIPFVKVRELSNFKSKDNNRLYEVAENMGKKILKYDFRIEDDKSITLFNIFTKYKVKKEKKEIQITINSEFAYILRNIISNFTPIALNKIMSISTTSTKMMFYNIYRFRNTGVWKVSYNDFIHLFGVKDWYSQGDIDKNIINPAIKELEQHFNNLKCEKIYDSVSLGKGRPKVVGYTFTFDKYKKKNRTFDTDNYIGKTFSNSAYKEIQEKAKKYNVSEEELINAIIEENIYDY